MPTRRTKRPKTARTLFQEQERQSTWENPRAKSVRRVRELIKRSGKTDAHSQCVNFVIESHELSLQFKPEDATEIVFLMCAHQIEPDEVIES